MLLFVFAKDVYLSFVYFNSQHNKMIFLIILIALYIFFISRSRVDDSACFFAFSLFLLYTKPRPTALEKKGMRTHIIHT